MPTPDPAAVARSLSKHWPGGAQALRAIDALIPRGRITALLGPNGSGKTTLLHVLAGRARATSGSAEVLGCDPGADSSSFRARIAFVAQDVELDPEMSVRETLGLFATLHGMPRDAQPAAIEALSDAFGLGDHGSTLASSLSGGQRRRLHVALGLLHRPELLLLDEPTSGLDPAGRAALWRLLAGRCAEGATVVVVAHDLDDVERHAHHVVILDRGGVLASGPPDELRARHASARLALRLEASADDAEGLADVLASIDGVSRVACDGRDVSVESSLDRPPTEAVLAAVLGRGLAVTSFEAFPANLASAYFHLTGDAATGSPAPTLVSRRGARARRAGSGRSGDASA